MRPSRRGLLRRRLCHPPLVVLVLAQLVLVALVLALPGHVHAGAPAGGGSPAQEGTGRDVRTPNGALGTGGAGAGKGTTVGRSGTSSWAADTQSRCVQHCRVAVGGHQASMLQR